MNRQWYGPTVNLDLTKRTQQKHAKRRTKREVQAAKLEFAIVETVRRHPGLTRGEIHKQLTDDRVRASLHNVVTTVDRLTAELRLTYELDGKPSCQVYRLNESYYYQQRTRR